MFQKLFYKSWPLVLILVIVLVFHSKLFTPKLSIYITPDYGRSDSWHLSIANKFYYSKQLKENKIPIWNSHIGSGYPTLAEGQTGIFFLPNIIFLKFFPFVIAYNLLMVFTFAAAGWGAYFFLRSIKVTKLAATYGGIIFCLGSFFVFRVQHLHVIQVASLAPWTFFAVNEYLKQKNLIFLVLLSFFISQQLFAGFPQLAAYNLIFLLIFILLTTPGAQRLKNLFFIITFILIGFSLSSVQIFPAYELLNNSTKLKDPKTILEQFPYKPKNLLQIIDPFALGNPKFGTYPVLNRSKFGIFWENTAYVGILPLSLSLALLLSTIKKRRSSSKIILIFGFFLLLALSLSLGKSSPLHPLFSIPPLSMFRVPSRFLLFVHFSFVVLSSIYLSKQRKWITFLAIILSSFNVFIVLYTYNPVGSASSWFEKPETKITLEKTAVQKVITIGNFPSWTEMFSKGWTNPEYYFFARNYLDQNSNLIFDIDQINAYESILTKRSSLNRQLTDSALRIEKDFIEISPLLIPYLSSQNVSHVITTKKIFDKNLKEIYTKKISDENEVKIYEIKIEPKKYFTSSNYFYNEYPSEIVHKATSQSYKPLEEVIIEKDIGKLNGTYSEIKKIESSDIKKTFEVKTDGKLIFVLNESFYPGWKAYLNGKKTEILPVNINFQGIVIPGNGTFMIEFKYRPDSLKYGMLFSSLTLVFLLIFTLFLIKGENLTRVFRRIFF